MTQPAADTRRIAEARLREAMPALEALLALSLEQVIGYVRADGGVSVHSAQDFVRETRIRSPRVDEPGVCIVLVEVGDGLVPLRLRRVDAQRTA